MFNLLKNHTLNLINQACKAKKITGKPVIIIGLSGGPDSVFLLHLLKNFRDDGFIQLIAAHLDHQWRPESGSDAHFCSKLCKELDIPLVIAKANNLDINFKHNGSKEETGRRLRRFFFQQIKQEHCAHFIALAHHLNDQQETFFLRLLRGTTLSGLHGMNDIQEDYVRPLLNIPKKEILDYLDKKNLTYLIDPTNSSQAFLRNRIRDQAIPALQACDARFANKFITTLHALKEEDAFLQKLAEKTFLEFFIFNEKTQGFVGNLTVFKALHAVIQKRVILHWLIKEHVAFTPSTPLIDEILRFVQTKDGGSHAITSLSTIFKKQGSVWIEKNK